MSAPLIGITCGTASIAGQTPRFGTNQVYVTAVERAGGVAILVPPMTEAAALVVLGRIDGLLVPGGADVDPRAYGEEPRAGVDEADRERDELELQLVRAAVERGVPVLGICRGQQVINVALGGDLYQDLTSQRPGPTEHRTPSEEGRDRLAHSIDITAGSWLAGAVGSETVEVNSLHHQAVRRLGRGLRSTAVSADGVIEALESNDHLVVAVQCHPEELPGLRWASAIFDNFVAAADRSVV